MVIRPTLPLTIAALPRQRLHEVVALPPRPAGWEPEACLYEAPTAILPRHRPRRMDYLGTVEWAWNPMSSRIESYYLHAARRHWVLWTRDPFPNDEAYRWLVAAYAPRADVEASTAARHLLVAAWEAEAAERYLDHFHWIAEVGQLGVPDWMAIGRAVWPRETSLSRTAGQTADEGADA